MPPKPPDPDHVLLLGFTAANLIAFAGILVNFYWNWHNGRRDKRTRRNALSLDHFSNSVRAPLQELMQALAAHMDTADDIVTWGADLASRKITLQELAKSFHGTRRKLARMLTDYDQSQLIDGDRWSELEGRDMDNATFSLQQAGRAADIEDLKRELHSFAQNIQAVLNRLTKHLDERASRLMNS